MIIVSKFPGRCNACNLPVKVGDRVEWSRSVRGVSHEACVQNPHQAAAALEDARQKAAFAERERQQEQAAFMSDPDMRFPPDPPSEPPEPAPKAPTFEEYARTLEVPF